jgi:leucyl aminopeptidase
VSKGHWISAFIGNILSSSSGVEIDILNLDNEGKYVFLKNPGI